MQDWQKNLFYCINIHLSFIITLPVYGVMYSPGHSWSEVVEPCALVMLAWASTLGVWSRLENCMVMCEKSTDSLNVSVRASLFTGRAKRWGQTLGEIFVLVRGGVALLLSPLVAPSSSTHNTEPTQMQQMLLSGCLKGTFPIQAPHCFPFSCSIVSISLCGLLLHRRCSLCWLSLPLCL